MTSELSSWKLAISLRRPLSQLPCHTPLVRGCAALTDRAQPNTCGSSAPTASSLSERSTLRYCLAGLSGSFHRSQPSTRWSLRNWLMTPTT